MIYDGPDTRAADIQLALATVVAGARLGDVVVGVRRIRARDRAGLHPAERAAMARAVDRRYDEFATGRALLRALLGTDVTIPVASDRRPDLPAGTVASLAHDDAFAVAVVARDPVTDGIAAVGVDIEPVRPLEAEVAAVVTRPDEREIDALLVFCAKEAVYKAWSHGGGGLLEHHDVRVHLDGATFTASVVDHGTEMVGVWALAGGRYVTLAVRHRADR